MNNEVVLPHARWMCPIALQLRLVEGAYVQLEDAYCLRSVEEAMRIAEPIEVCTIIVKASYAVFRVGCSRAQNRGAFFPQQDEKEKIATSGTLWYRLSSTLLAPVSI